MTHYLIVILNTYSIFKTPIPLFYAIIRLLDVQIRNEYYQRSVSLSLLLLAQLKSKFELLYMLAKIFV